jgi:hypothetical protein
VDCREHLCNAKVNFKFSGEFDSLFEEQIREAYTSAKENMVNFMAGEEVIEQHDACTRITEFSIMLHI